MKILNLKIDKIAIHQIFQRGTGNVEKEPVRGKELVKFDSNARETFTSRVISSVGESSKSVLMDIIKTSESETPSIVQKLSQSNTDDGYLEISFSLAKKLQDKQQSRSIPGGIVVVFSGVVQENRKLVGIIKADIHNGYEKTKDNETGTISLKFVKELLLTPSSRLYKVAVFFQKKNIDCRDNLNDWEACVSDYQINQADGKVSAKYFYSEFCGLGYPETGSRKTLRFYEETRNYIGALNKDEIEKGTLYTALNVYLVEP